MKNKFLNIFIFIFLIFSLVGCAGEMGPQGPQGEQGIQGIQGEQGTPGKDGVDGQNGKDGTSLLTGNGEPTNVIGIVGDSYIDLDTWSFYIKTTNGWVISGNIKGEKGDSGVIEYDGTEGLDFYPINDEKCGVSVGRAFLQENIVIPSLYNGRKVTQIIYEGFAGCSNLTSITLPETLETLDADAFNYCSNLENVYYKGTIDKWCSIVANNAGFESSPMYYADNFYMLDENKEWYCLEELIIPDNVETINFGVFSNFNNITDLTLPSSVKTIGAYAFEYCESLENIYYDGTVEDWCNIKFETYGFSSSFSNPMKYAENVYFLDENGDIEYNGNKYSLLTELVIPNTITKINNFAFYNCTNLTSVIIPNSVENVGDRAFEGCSCITNIEVPDCNFISYNLKHTVKEVKITGGTSIDSEYFKSTNLEKIIIGDSITSIGSFAFSGCWYLESITIGNSVTTIGDEAFLGCNSLKSLVLPGSIESIGNNVFNRCKNLESIIIPDGVTSIGYGVFEGCTSLKGIIIPNSVKSIDGNAFKSCSSLTSIVIPDSVISIGYDVFSYCDNLSIYCEVDSKPSTWDEYWKYRKIPVYWAGEWEYDANGNPVPLN